MPTQSKAKTSPKLSDVLSVIGIVLVVAFILFPLNPVPDSGRELSKCTAHLKHIGFALVLYKSDNNDKLPDSLYKQYGAVEPYIREKSVFLCPKDTPPYAFRLPPTYKDLPTSFFPNQYLGSRSFPYAARYLEESEPNPVTFVCVLHGKKLRPSVSWVDDTEGRVTRLRLDTSMSRPVVPVSCYMDKDRHFYSGRIWGVYSDYKPTAKMLDEIVWAEGVTEVPCSEMR